MPVLPMVLQALSYLWAFSPYEVGYGAPGYGDSRNDFDYDDYDGYYGGDYYKRRRRPHKAPRVRFYTNLFC